MQGRPLLGLFFLDQRFELFLALVLLVKLLQVVGRHRHVERLRGGELGQEIGIGNVPAVADGKLVDDFEPRRLALGKQIRREAAGGEVLVAQHVLEAVAKILRRKRMAVRPFVTRADPEGEDAAFFDCVRFEDVGREDEFLVVADEASVAVDGHQANVLRPPDEHAHGSAVSPRRTPAAFHVDEARRGGQARLHRRQLALLDLGLEAVGLEEGGRGRARRAEQAEEAGNHKPSVH